MGELAELDRIANLVSGLALEILNWLRPIMPEDFDFEAAGERIDRILEGD